MLSTEEELGIRSESGAALTKLRRIYQVMCGRKKRCTKLSILSDLDISDAAFITKPNRAFATLCSRKPEHFSRLGYKQVTFTKPNRIFGFTARPK